MTSNTSKKKKKEEEEEEEKKVLSSFCNFPPSILNFLLPFYNFPSFLLHFPPFSFFFSCLFFPGRSAEISRSEVSGGHSAPRSLWGHFAPCPPHLLRHWVLPIIAYTVFWGCSSVVSPLGLVNEIAKTLIAAWF